MSVGITSSSHSLVDCLPLRVLRKAWELLARTESEGDHRGSIVALREVRECLESLGEMFSKAQTQMARAQRPRSLVSKPDGIVLS